jgi:hypothetical protein
MPESIDDTIICDECGTEQDAGNVACEECGEDIEIKVDPPPDDDE